MNDSSKVRVRFAPSPTGFLHVGGARTALFNWLYARGQGGAFVLRIEDTDRERSSDEHTQAILDGMDWLGLDWDEGPLHQADGLARHRRDALRLLDSGAAYRCFCTAEDLERRRAEHADGADAFRYDRRCAGIPRDESEARAARNEPHTLRMLVPEGKTSWDDAVHGTIEFDNADIEDFIVVRTDGTPIYNMAVVSDDIDMRITHVIRGDDHISNTPKQILLYNALGAVLPVFAHVPMILGPDGKRLSKRHGATAVGEYHTQGILPDAMVNFLALLGWSTGTDEEIFSREQLVARFSLDGINRKSAVFDTQKLEWMNGRYLAELSSESLVPALRQAYPDAPDRPDGWWTELVGLIKVRARTVVELINQARPYIDDHVTYEEAAVAKHWKDPQAVIERLREVRRRFDGLSSWTADVLERELREAATAAEVGAGKMIHPLRVALTGNAASPGIFDIIVLLGRDRTLQRVDRAIELLEANARAG